MKFSFYVLTAALLVAAAAAGYSSGMHLFGRNFGILDTNNLEPTAIRCPNIKVVGKLQSLTIKGCSTQPCQLQSGDTLNMTYIIECGAPENRFKLLADIKGLFLLTLFPLEQYQCVPGQKVVIKFALPVIPVPFPVPFSVAFSLVGNNNGCKDHVESCVNVDVVINPAPAAQQIP